MRGPPLEIFSRVLTQSSSRPRLMFLNLGIEGLLSRNTQVL